MPLDGYDLVVDSLQAVLETGVPNGVVISQGDYDLFNQSHSGVVVLDYAGLRQVRATLGAGYERSWDIAATIGIVVTHPKQVHDDIAALRQHCLDTVGRDPDLSQELLQIEDVSGNLVPEDIEAGGNNWRMEILTFTVKELKIYYA